MPKFQLKRKAENENVFKRFRVYVEFVWTRRQAFRN